MFHSVSPATGCSYWAGSLNRHNSTHCLFLDLAKAFDSISHACLLLKSEALGVTDNLLVWLRSFLLACHHRVVSNGEFSSWVYLPLLGCPRALCLAPLFSYYMNDILSVVTNSTVFADDVTIYKEINCPADVHLLQLAMTFQN